MIDWITDRRPELEEATNEGYVWVYDVEADEYLIRNYTEIKEGQPWMEIPSPPSYVKPKRYAVRYSDDLRCWVITINGNVLFGSCLFEPLSCLKDKNSDLHREAAERIAEIYEEMLP